MPGADALPTFTTILTGIPSGHFCGMAEMITPVCNSRTARHFFDLLNRWITRGAAPCGRQTNGRAYSRSNGFSSAIFLTRL
jgi:hypothetical protein